MCLNAQRHPAIFAARSLNPNGEDTPNVGAIRERRRFVAFESFFFVFVRSAAAAAVLLSRGRRPLLFFAVGRYLPVYTRETRSGSSYNGTQVLSKRNTFFKRPRTLGSRCSFVERGKKCCDPETKDRIIPLWFSTYIHIHNNIYRTHYICIPVRIRCTERFAVDRVRC